MDELIKSSGFEKMISDIETLVNASKNELATSINKVMTVTYWIDILIPVCIRKAIYDPVCHPCIDCLCDISLQARKSS